jgi:hypothetical protein
MSGELAALRAETEQAWVKVRADLEEALAELQKTRLELCRLRELQARARGQREEIARTRAIASFACAQREPDTWLQ